MKPISPHDPLDDLIAAALHGELTPEERAQLDTRLQTDDAAQAAYQEAQAMHDLLEKNYKAAQPDPAFEQRMVSGVRRKLQHEQHRETAWESLLALWAGLKGFFVIKPGSSRFGGYLRNGFVLLAFVAIAVSVLDPAVTSATRRARFLGLATPTMLAQDVLDDAKQKKVVGDFRTRSMGDHLQYSEPEVATTPQGGTVRGSALVPPSPAHAPSLSTGISRVPMAQPINAPTIDSADAVGAPPSATSAPTAIDRLANIDEKDRPDSGSAAGGTARNSDYNVQAMKHNVAQVGSVNAVSKSTANLQQNPALPAGSIHLQPPAAPPAATTAPPPAPDTRKLIRNAQLDLEVKSFQAAMDQIAALTKDAGGYVDTSNSQKGGNGKLQGAVVVKVLPQNLDGFLFKLRDLGQVQNQSVSTDDVTKDYIDTQARLDNSRRMETQLQDLLKHANSKVSDLLQVERELGRVRGEIEQMQGQLKLYDFQVEYATVTMQVREKDLNQTAAYLLKEQDEFSLFATDVEGTFQKARQAADQFKTQVLVANLVHNSGSDVAAELTVMVAPDQIDSFLAQVRSLGRVANFTRQTQRVARDGGDSSQPADQTLTEKDKVQVHLAIHSDDESRKQVALTVVAKAVDAALDQAKAAALAQAGTEILNSSLNKTPQGQSTAQLSVRVPGQSYAALIAALEALGRTASLSIQRNDNSGPGANGDDAPVIVSLSLTDDDTPLQETDMSVLASSEVDNQAQQIKKDAATAGVEVKSSSFERAPDGTELAQMTFRLPMSKYPAFVESLKQLGKVESLSVHRDDRPDETRTDENAPAEISLQLHNQRDIVADNNGLWATLRRTFGDGFAALFGSVRVIGVIVAFLVPWVFTLILAAWIGRRIYVWRRNR